MQGLGLLPADVIRVNYILQQHLRNADAHTADKPVVTLLLRALNLVAGEDTDDGVMMSTEDSRGAPHDIVGTSRLRFDQLPKSLLAKELPPYHEGHSLQRYFTTILYAFTHGSLVDALEMLLTS